MIYPNQTTVRFRRLVCSVAALAASGIVSGQTTAAVPAEGDSPAELVKLSPFVVSSESENGYRSAQTMVGSRTSKSLLEIASSVSIINQQQIADLNAVEVHEVLQFGVAGVTQNQTINDDVNIRGFRTTFSLRDGVTKTSFKRNPMFDVERVEVIKGPGAMLLGNNSFLGGGVNFVTRQPSHQKQGDVSVTVGENNFVRFTANSTGPVVDQRDFKLDYRLTLGGLVADKEKEIENEDQKFVGGAVTAYFGDNTRVLLNGYFMQDNGYFYWEDFLDYNSTLGTAAAPRTAVLNQYSTKSFSPARSRDAFWDNQDIFVNLTFLSKLTDNANLRLSYFYADIVDSRRIVRGITISADNRTLVRQDIPFAGSSYNHTLQADFNHKFQHRYFTLDSTLGADGTTQYSRQDQSVNSMPSLDTANPNLAADDAYFAVPTFGAGRPHTSQQITRPESLSYYFQENLGLLKDRLMLVGGLRWFYPAGSNKNNITGVVTDRPSDSFKTHKYGVIVRPIPAISVYYTDSQNVFPQIGRTDRFQRDDQLGAPLSAQEGKMKEYGIKFDHSFNDTLSAYGSVTYYDMSLTHVRTFGVLPEGIPPGTVGIVESAADMSQGWEFEYGLRMVSSAGELNLIGTYADGESQTAADPKQMAVDFVPRKTSLMARYAWKSGPLSGFMVGATYFDQSQKRNASYWIDFPATYNLFSRYAWGRHWSVQLNLNNITDERYIVAIAGNGLVQTTSGFDTKLAVKYVW
jgi:iron complex outermembrane receptor protein